MNQEESNFFINKKIAISLTGQKIFAFIKIIYYY